MAVDQAAKAATGMAKSAFSAVSNNIGKIGLAVGALYYTSFFLTGGASAALGAAGHTLQGAWAGAQGLISAATPVAQSAVASVTAALG